MPWSLKLTALCVEEPPRLLRFLSGTILACGGWVLSRSCSGVGVQMNFEFERSGCVDIYTALIAAGLELSHDSHLRLTELCQCTRNQVKPVLGETVGVELEVLARTREQLPSLAEDQLEIA